MADDQLTTEIDLISSSLLPAETLSASDEWPRVIEIHSDDSKLSLRIMVAENYPSSGRAEIEVKGSDIGREEGEGWREWVKGKMNIWDEREEYPLFQLLTSTFLPLLAPPSAPPSPAKPSTEIQPAKPDDRPHHALLTSHHLLSPTKRKNLNALSSSLSLIGFSKTGHPGIMYAIGTHDDLVEWVQKVKSWQWLALRVRMSPEPVRDQVDEQVGRGTEDGARGGRGRGRWAEVEKVGEALEWLRGRRRENLLTDLGIGAG